MSARTTRGLRIATRCSSIDQFVAAFNRFCDAQACFISTLTMRPVGLETAFSIDLATGTPALRGLGTVLEAWPTPGNRFGRPGLLLGIRKLTADSERVFERLLAAHAEATPPPMPAGSSIAAPLPLPTVVPDGERTPGSELVLPANPLMNISDHSLEGFVDCTLYEETGNFFPAPDPDPEPAEPVAEPPVLAPRRVTIPPATIPAREQPRAATEPIELPATLPPPFLAASPVTPPPIPPPFLAASPVTPPPVPMPLARPTIRRDELAPPMLPEPPPPLPLRHEPALPPRRARAITWPHRRIAVVGGVAVATIGLAVAVAARSGHAHVAEASPPAQLMASSSPAPVRSPAPPKTLADVAPATAPDDPGDAGGAPTFGSGPCKIAVSTTPAGSIVTVDGEVAGPSPITIGGPCGKRRLDIAHPRYAPATRVVTATPQPAAVDVALARPTHDLYVETSPPGAVVSIDGHRAGTSPTLVKVMGFTTLTLRIEKFGFAPRTQKVYSKVPHDRVAIRLGH